MARGYTDASIRALGNYATNEQTDPDIRIRSIVILLDRGWGRAAQPHTGAGGEGAIEITIRNIIEERKKK